VAMRVVELSQERGLVMVDRDVAELSDGQVRLDVAYCGVCGSDLHMRHTMPPGAVFGHEFSGTVSEVGADVSGWSKGDAVAVLPYTSCGTCGYCRSGNENQCVTGGHHGLVLGVQLQGGYADSVVVNPDSLYALSGSATLQRGALAEPVAVAVRAASAVADVDRSEPILVVGAGPIGLFTALALRAANHNSVVILERNAARAEVAGSLGFETVVGDDPAVGLRKLGIDQPPAVIECAGAGPAMNTAISLLRRQGRLVLIGLPMNRPEIDIESVILKEITASGTAGYSRDDFTRAVQLLADDIIPADGLITAVMSLDAATTAFEELTDPMTSHVKILLQP
jgi:(R,R)-butanediol dehydrogenase / meso-butanediol dehydrogenase / diacetyl reductase